MKKLLSPSVLSLLVGASILATVILCIMHIQYTRRIRAIQSTQQQLLAVQQRQTMMQQLGADLRVYSQTHPAIKPLLNSVTAKPSKP